MYIYLYSHVHVQYDKIDNHNFLGLHVHVKQSPSAQDFNQFLFFFPHSFYSLFSLPLSLPLPLSLSLTSRKVKTGLTPSPTVSWSRGNRQPSASRWSTSCWPPSSGMEEKTGRMERQRKTRKGLALQPLWEGRCVGIEGGEGGNRERAETETPHIKNKVN